METDLLLNMTGFVSQTHQKLSIRRAQAKHAGSMGPVDRLENDDPHYPWYLKNQSGGNASQLGGMSDLLASEADYMNVAELSDDQLEWDYSAGDVYAFRATVATDSQWTDPNYHNFEGEECETQTYFSFIELITSKDIQLDNPFESSTGMQECYPAHNFDQGVHFDEIDQTIQDGSSQKEFPMNEPTGIACQKCHLNQPPPGLLCQACGMHIHSHCSPWEESEEPAENDDWRYGHCHEWW